MKNKHYFAFISYKRGGLDEQVANWIHTKLEKYPYPVKDVAKENQPDDKVFIRRIFIDTKELPVRTNEFTKDIKLALENSRYLLVISSKESINSVYVNREVAYFLHTHNHDTSLILPIFIDDVSCGLPKSIEKSNLLERNCPIYNSRVNNIDKENLYCFYHIVAFLLKIDFQKLYDRYKKYKEKKVKQRKYMKITFNSLIIILIAVLSLFLYEQYKLIKHQEHIVRLEKEIFPSSVVVGYVDNFLRPVVDYIKTNEPNTHIYVHMPTTAKDINDQHKVRYDTLLKNIENILGVDSIRNVTLKTNIPRGSTIHKIYTSSNDYLNAKYIDFATTTSAFLAIAEKKKNNPAYCDEDIDDMIKEYTDIFIQLVNNSLEEDSIYVTFITKISNIQPANQTD